MDIKIPDSALRKFLKTTATPAKIAEVLTLCGPSVDRLHGEGKDTVYEIEAITNRVDSASAFGIAREAAAILPLFGIKAKLINNPYDLPASSLPQRDSAKLPLEVIIQDETLVPRFSAVILDHLTVKPSPLYIQHQLQLAGVRPLNNLIDITNYLTLLYGQPAHIFDYDKIIGAKMTLRSSRTGEQIITLDNQTHSLRGDDIVIEDGGGRLIDLCGIMGGKLSQVDDKTTRAILFVQTYNSKKIRRTSLYTQERTLAAQIFEKNPDSRLVAPVLIEGLKLLLETASGKVASESIDLYHLKPKPHSLTLDLKWLSGLIGHIFDSKTTTSILKNLGFQVKKINHQLLEITVPSWRLHDVTITEDLAEEVARVYGYFRLEGQLPTGVPLSVYTDPELTLEYQAKNYLSALGFTEVFNYSLVSQALFEKANISLDHTIKLQNPLTSDYEYMRRSLVPSLLDDLSVNQGKVTLPIRIFELANIYLLNNNQLSPTILSQEKPILATAIQGLDYRQAKGYLEIFFNKLNIRNIHFKTFNENVGPWKSNETAEIYSDDVFLGIFGSIRENIKTNFGLTGDIYLANLDFTTITTLHTSSGFIYSPISEYPDLVEDITLESNQSLSNLIQLIKQSSPLLTTVNYKTSLKNKHTFQIHLNDPQNNLTQADANLVKKKILSRLKASASG